MKINISNIELDLKNYRQKIEANDKYMETMEAFVKEAQSRYETLECMFNKMNETYKDLADFYAFEQNKYSLGEFFTDLKTFSNQFIECNDENIKLRETEEKIKRAEEEREQREKEKQARKIQKEKLMQSSTGGNGDTGVMDNLLEALQSGKLFEIGNSNGPMGINGIGRGRRPIRETRRDVSAMMGKRSLKKGHLNYYFIVKFP
jgi:hypothetical protein